MTDDKQTNLREAALAYSRKRADRREAARHAAE